MMAGMMIKNGDLIRKTWILLDTLSTDSVTNNLDYVEDVKIAQNMKSSQY